VRPERLGEFAFRRVHHHQRGIAEVVAAVPERHLGAHRRAEVVDWKHVGARRRRAAPRGVVMAIAVTSGLAWKIEA
jgi:hypothetical protein